MTKREGRLALPFLIVAIEVRRYSSGGVAVSVGGGSVGASVGSTVGDGTSVGIDVGATVGSNVGIIVSVGGAVATAIPVGVGLGIPRVVDSSSAACTVVTLNVVEALRLTPITFPAIL